MQEFTSLEEALKHFFGYDTFRPGQKQIIQEALNNQDLLVIMPTGGGKSLCFQLPALLKPGLTSSCFSPHCFNARSSRRATEIMASVQLS